MTGRTFDKFAGDCAWATGIAGAAYSVLFVAYVKGHPAAFGPAAFFLLVAGALSIPVAVALAERFKPQSSGFANTALIFAILGGLGGFLHGGKDLGTAINPQGGPKLSINPADPRGLLTFGAAAVGVVLFAKLMTGSPAFPARLARLGYVLAFLLVVIYLGRLIILDPNQPILGATAVLAGLVINPAWFIWIGKSLKAPPTYVGIGVSHDPQKGSPIES
jgi:hypothetical protein